MATVTCPLCESGDHAPFFTNKHREFFCCSICKLVFVPNTYHLNPEREKAQYDLHQNNPEDAHYRKFLSRLTEPLVKRLNEGAKGLDFGSGPGPTLSVMMAEKGFEMSIYDIFYSPDKSVFNQTYDFITATEVLEHLSKPGEVLKKLWQMLNPGGWLGIMTKRVESQQSFASWHYKNDPTHIVFFAEETFFWLEKQWSAEIFLLGGDVVLLRKV